MTEAVSPAAPSSILRGIAVTSLMAVAAPASAGAAQSGGASDRPPVVTPLPVAPPAPPAPGHAPRRYPVGDISSAGLAVQRSGAIVSGPDWSDFKIYPASALRRNQEGAVSFWLLLDAAGRPAACGIRQSSGFVELDDGTCDLAMQMRFRAAGDATSAIYRARVTWMLADPTLMAPGQLSAALTLRAGRVIDCRISELGNVPPEWSRAACRIIAGDAGYFLADNRERTRRATVSITLRPPGDATDWPRPPGRLVATRRTEFKLLGNGDPSDCRVTRDDGFGRRSFDYSGRCGLFLTQTWLARGAGEPDSEPSAVEIDVFAVP